MGAETECHAEASLGSVAFGAAWQSLGEIFEVRNRIAHAGSISDERTQKAIKSQNDIFEQGDVNDYTIKIKEDGIEKVCDLMQQALRDINNRLFAPVSKKAETEQAVGPNGP